MVMMLAVTAFLAVRLASAGPPQALSAICRGASAAPGSCRLVQGAAAKGASAWAVFEDTVAERGFASLRVTGSSGKDDKEMAFAGGVVEGALTATRTAQHFNTSFASEFGASGGDPSTWKVAQEFLSDNDNYVRAQIAVQAETSAYWKQVALVWAQLDGLIEGHRLAGLRLGGAPVAALDRIAFLFVNALVDLSSVVDKPFAHRNGVLPTDVREWTASDAASFVDRTTHCSALVKVTADYSELFTAHNTWTGFFTMLRVAKLYDLPFRGAAARKAAFPGYFGTLSSNDDLFVLSSGLVVQETTNAVFPPRKEMCTPKSVLTWARTIVANRVAQDGRSWTEWFAKENSGTINNQWMVVDYNKFVPYQPLPDGTLWVLEQLPSYIQSADLTSYLRQGHWPSFNIPFFPEVQNLSGNADMERRFGLSHSYELNPRAKIFRRDAPKVETREQLHTFMRYNDWRNDPLSAAGYGGPTEPRSPENAIAARSDLIPKDAHVKEQLALRGAFGNTDAKVVSREDVLKMRFDFVVGPTTDDQVPFAWSGDWAHLAHEGQPTTFDFKWESVSFEGLGSSEASLVV